MLDNFRLNDCPWVSEDRSVATITLVFASKHSIENHYTAFLIGLEQWCYCRADLNSNILILEMVNVH